MDSEIVRQPPHVREVWDYLLMVANHKPYKNIKRGQVFVSLEDIRQALSWRVGFRKECYTKDSMKKAMKALTKASMIVTNRSTRGVLITICNYERYQDPKNYESSNESSNESSAKAPRKLHDSPYDIQECNNDKNKELRKKEVSVPYDLAISIWNELLKDKLSEVRGFTEKRKANFRERWKDELDENMDTWRLFCSKILRQQFLLGKNDRGWKANIDWALKPNSITKTLEGGYMHDVSQNAQERPNMRKPITTRTTVDDAFNEKIGIKS